MFSLRSVVRPRAAVSAGAVATPGLDGIHESPLVPCNNLRARWVVAESGQLELRWELPEAPSQARAA